MSSPIATSYQSVDTTVGKPSPRRSGIPISRSRILSSSPRIAHQPEAASRTGKETATRASDVGASTSRIQNASMRPLEKTSTGTRTSDQHPHQHLVTPLRNIVRSVSDRSMDRQSIDSVQLAMKLGRAVGEGEGEGWFVDEVAPFVTGTGDGTEERRSSEVVNAEKTAAHDEGSRRDEDGEDVSSGSFPREINLDEDTSFYDNLDETPPTFQLESQNNTPAPLSSASQMYQTPAPKPIPKSASGPIARSTPPSARSRTISALKSTHPPRSASGSSLSTPRTSQSQSKKSPSMNSIASSLTRSHGSGSLTSSTSTTKHYPAEAYMVPRIREYEVAEAGWDDTVLPTVARKLQRDSGASAGGVEDAVEDQLVTEWTPDGRPVRVEKVQGSKVRTKWNGAMRIAKESDLVSYMPQVVSILLLTCCFHQQNGQAVPPSSEPLGSGDDNAVLDDVLRDLDMEDAAGDQSLDPAIENAGDPKSETSVALADPLVLAGIPKASDDPIRIENSPLNDEREKETSKPDMTLAKTFSTGKPSANTPPEHSPSRTKTAPAPRSDSQPKPATSKSSHTGQASRVAAGNNMEMRNMEKRTGSEVKKAAPARPGAKSGSKEEHGGGCRCVVM